MERAQEGLNKSEGLDDHVNLDATLGKRTVEKEVKIDSREKIGETRLRKTDTASSTKDSKGGKKDVRQDCPFLSTIRRHLLDFDYEKFCSVTMTNKNVYCCLVCGKFYQGRGKGTICYTHALEQSHYLFINLSDEKVYCLPDNYEVVHKSLEDIKVLCDDCSST